MFDNRIAIKLIKINKLKWYLNRKFKAHYSCSHVWFLINAIDHLTHVQIEAKKSCLLFRTSINFDVISFLNACVEHFNFYQTKFESHQENWWGWNWNSRFLTHFWNWGSFQILHQWVWRNENQPQQTFWENATKKRNYCREIWLGVRVTKLACKIS